MEREKHFRLKEIVIVLMAVMLLACNKQDDPEPSLPPLLAELLEEMNEVRSKGHTCGGQWYGPAAPLLWEDRLGRAAQLHAEDMAEGNYLSHYSADGRDPGQRISQQGYNWHTYGENIARGFQSPTAVLQAWLSSEGHCRNIVSPNFTQVGLGYDPRGHFWVQVFARPAN
ncbi:MAG: CAP domain-containing protein [Bacteroidales bacterium]